MRRRYNLNARTDCQFIVQFISSSVSELVATLLSFYFVIVFIVVYFGCFFVRFVFTCNFCTLSCVFSFFSVESLALNIAILSFYASLSDFSLHRSGISWFHVLKRIQLCDLLFFVGDTVAKACTAASILKLIFLFVTKNKQHQEQTRPSPD